MPGKPEFEDLARILAAIRFTESKGNYAGDYSGRQFVNGEEYIGAYSIPRSQWQPWSTFAGLRGAPAESSEAQDKTAASVLMAYYNHYGSWDMAITAWFAGPENTNAVIGAGGIAALEQYMPEAAQYLSAVTSSSDKVPSQFLKPIEPSMFALQTAKGNGWVMPVAGESEWSRGSFMDKHTKHSGSHHAIDVYAQEGTPIVAPVAGKVTSSGSGGRGGNWVRMLGNDGVEYYFAHMAAETVAAKGSVVRPGFHLGYVGDTGSAKGTKHHLHFSMKKDGRAINPSQFLESGNALSWNEQTSALDPRAGEIGYEEPYTSQGAMMTGWLQGLSSQMAEGDPVLPERGRFPADELDEGIQIRESRQPAEEQQPTAAPRGIDGINY